MCLGTNNVVEYFSIAKLIPQMYSRSYLNAEIRQAQWFLRPLVKYFTALITHKSEKKS